MMPIAGVYRAQAGSKAANHAGSMKGLNMFV